MHQQFRCGPTNGTLSINLPPAHRQDTRIQAQRARCFLHTGIPKDAQWQFLHVNDIEGSVQELGYTASTHDDANNTSIPRVS